MKLPDLADLEDAARTVHTAMPATPQYRWPLLDAALGLETWVKHENHGQSIAFAARRSGLQAAVVVPHGNSREKHAAMRKM